MWMELVGPEEGQPRGRRGSLASGTTRVKASRALPFSVTPTNTPQLDEQNVLRLVA